MTTHNTIRFFDMFAGIGGFRAGLERASGFTCIGHSEIDRHAEKAYCAIHNIKPNEIFYEDATNIDAKALPGFDLLCAGFPCQPFSIAGKRRGFDDARGALFFEIARVAREKQPAYLFLENVPGLLSHDKGRTFAAILGALHELGYHVEWQVLNSKDFGVPQSRCRLYIVGYLNPQCAGEILPLQSTNPKAPKCLIAGSWNHRVYSADGTSPTLLTKKDRTGLYAVTTHSDVKNTIQIKEATKKGYKTARLGDSIDLGFPDINTRRGRVGAGIAHTLNTSGLQGVLAENCCIRRLTPRECFRLQGFSEVQIDKLLSVDSDTQAYKQAGNAVTVNVAHALALRLKAAHKATAGLEVTRKEAT